MVSPLSGPGPRPRAPFSGHHATPLGLPRRLGVGNSGSGPSPSRRSPAPAWASPPPARFPPFPLGSRPPLRTVSRDFRRSLRPPFSALAHFRLVPFFRHSGRVPGPVSGPGLLGQASAVPRRLARAPAAAPGPAPGLPGGRPLGPEPRPRSRPPRPYLEAGPRALFRLAGFPAPRGPAPFRWPRSPWEAP